VGQRESPLEALELKNIYPQPDAKFWRGKRVWISGHTGFKGAWLALWLVRLGAKVRGYSLTPATDPSLFDLLCLTNDLEHQIADIVDKNKVQQSIHDFRPEVVFHLAAQALVRPSYLDPALTFTTNFQGTVNVLEAVRSTKTARVVVAVTTDKVYRNHENGQAFQEEDPLGGKDPYSASKSAAEMAIASYRESFFQRDGIALAAARAGNVIGGGDWSVDRIIPDAVRAWGSGGILAVRNPEATRPWQHVLEPLAAYLRLAESLFLDPGLAGDYNFGPPPTQVGSVRDVVLQAKEAFGAGEIRWGTEPSVLDEARTLCLENHKAKQILGVTTVWSLDQAIEKTMSWYRRQLKGEKAIKLCEADFEAFLSTK